MDLDAPLLEPLRPILRSIGEGLAQQDALDLTSSTRARRRRRRPWPCPGVVRCPGTPSRAGLEGTVPS